MTYPGLGGQQPPPQNAAPAQQLVPGVQPGATGQVVASRVIIIGTGGELLVYTPTAAAGNLLVSIAGSAGTDSFGNSYPAGLSVGLPGGPQIQIADVGGTGTIQITSGSADFTAGLLDAGVNGSPAYASMGIIGPASTTPGSGDFVAEAFNSANQLGSSTANLQWFYIDTSGGVNETGSMSAAGWEFLYPVDIAGGTLTIGGATITQTNFNMDPPMGIPSGYPLSTTGTDTNSGSTFVSGERALMNSLWSAPINQIVDCLNSLISELQNRGMIS